MHTPSIHPPTAGAGLPGWLTYETGLWIAIAALAVAARAVNLDHAPLTNAEAAGAFQAWAVAQGQTASLANPLFDTLQALVFAVAGASDGAARLIPALAGAAVCLWPLAARRRADPLGALIFGALLAVSPTLWHASRQADGALLAWALAFGIWCAWRTGRVPAGWLGAGLLAACGRDAVSPALALAVVLALDRSARWSRAARPAAADLGLAALSFAVASTAAGLRLNGIGDAFNGYALWFSAAGAPGPMPVDRGLLGLLVYEPLIGLGALLSLVLLLLSRVLKRPAGTPLADWSPWLAWAGAGLLLFLLNQSRQPAGLAPLIAGCAALASASGATLAQSWIIQRRSHALLPILAIGFVMLVYAYLGLGLYAGQGQDLWLLTAVIALLMVAGIIIVAMLTFNPAVALTGIGTAAAAGLALYTLSAGIQLTQIRPDNPAEPYIVDAAPLDLGELARNLETLSSRAYGDPYAASLQLADGASNSLRWAVHDQRQVTVGGRPGSAGIVMTPSGAMPDTQQPFIGSRYTVASAASLSDARCNDVSGQINCMPLARWLVFRNLDNVQQTEWVLWLRQDVARKASGQAAR